RRSRCRGGSARRARGVNYLFASSHSVNGHCHTAYVRFPKTISPPVDTKFVTPSPSCPREDFYLSAGALVPYKRTDKIIEAFNKLGRRLVVAGAGPELNRLRKAAKTNVEFRGWVTDEELRRLYRS